MKTQIITINGQKWEKVRAELRKDKTALPCPQTDCGFRSPRSNKDYCPFCERLREEGRKQVLKEVKKIKNKWQNGILKDNKCKHDYELKESARMAYNAMEIVCAELSKLENHSYGQTQNRKVRGTEMTSKTSVRDIGERSPNNHSSQDVSIEGTNIGSSSANSPRGKAGTK